MFTEKEIEILGAAAGNFGNSYAVLKDGALEPDLLEAIFQDVQGLKSEVRPAKMRMGQHSLVVPEWIVGSEFPHFSSIDVLVQMGSLRTIFLCTLK